MSVYIDRHRWERPKAGRHHSGAQMRRALNWHGIRRQRKYWCFVCEKMEALTHFNYPHEAIRHERGQ